MKMDTNKALEIIKDFKNGDLKERLNQLKSSILNKTKNEVNENSELLNAAIIVKNVSAQINEIVHAIGIINSLPIILDNDEKIINLSLASGAEGNGFDLETDKRVAEFKFSHWQEGNSANGMRKRQVFIDLVNLFMLQTNKKKELYVVNAEQIEKFFNGRAKWKNVLSKSGKLKERFEIFLEDLGHNELIKVKEIFQISNVEIMDIGNVLNIKF